MTVRLESLRITADMDVAGYVRAAQQKNAADAQMVQSVKSVGQAFAQMDMAASNSGRGLENVSRRWVTGYKDAMDFQKALTGLKRELDTGMDVGRAVVALDAMHKKFGLLASDEDLVRLKSTALSQAVSALSGEYERNAKTAQLSADAKSEIARRTDEATASLKRMSSVQAEINARLGVSSSTSGSARDSANAFLAGVGGLEGVAQAKAKSVADNFTNELNTRLVKGVSKSAKDSASVFAESFVVEDELRAKTEKLANSYDIVGAARARHLEVEKTMSAALKAGLVDQTKYNTIVDQSSRVLKDTEKSYAGAFTAQNKFGTATGLARHELVNFSRQAQDVFVSLASGQSPMTVFIQQGTQIADIFAASRGSLAGFATQILGALPAIAAVSAALVGLVAVVGTVYAAFKVSGERADLSRSLLGAGGASGLTGGQLNDLATESAKAADITVSSSRLIAAEYVRLGAVAASNLPRLTQLTKEYSIVTGQDMKTSAQDLAKALADPEKGAEALSGKLGQLDTTVTRGIRTAVTYNDTLRAQKLLMDGISLATQGAIESQTAWERLKSGAGKALDATLEGAAGLVLPRTQQEELNKLLTKQAEIRERINSASDKNSPAVQMSRVELQGVERQLRPLQELQRLEQGVARVRAERAQSTIIATAADNAGASAMQKSAADIAKAQMAVSAYERAIADATRQKDSLIPNADSRTQPQIANLVESIQKYEKSLGAAKQQLKDFQSVREGLTAQEERATRVQEAQAKAASARTMEEKKAAAVLMERAETFGVVMSAEQRLANEQRVRRQVQIDADNATRSSNQASADSVKVLGAESQGLRLSSEAMAKRNSLMEAARQESEKIGDKSTGDVQARFQRMLNEEIAKTVKLQDEKLRSSKDTLAVEAKTTAATMGQSPQRRADMQELARITQEIEQRRKAGLITDGQAQQALKDQLTTTKALQAERAKGAGSDYFFQQGQEIEALRKQRALIFETRDKRVEELEVMKAIQYVNEQGLDTNAGIGKQIVDRARSLGKEKQLTEDILRTREQIRQAQDFAADSMKSFLSDLLTGTEGLTGALKSLGKGFLSASLDALISGKGPLAGITGLASSTKDGQGGILGLFTNGIKGLGDDVKEGAKVGSEKGSSKGIETSLSGGSNWNVLSGLGIDGKSLAGGLTAIAGLAGAYGTGAAAGSYGQAVAGGALSGGMAGLALAGTGIGASLGGAAVLGPIGLIVGGALAYYGQKSARDAAKKKREEEAQENYRQAEPGIATLRSQLRGEAQDTLENRIKNTLTEVQKGIDVAFFAKKTAEATALADDFSTYKWKAIEDFQRAFAGLISSLEDGLGPNSAFSQARDSVKSTGDALKGFVSDAAFAFGKESEQVKQATEAAKTHALSILDGSKTLSLVGTRMEEIRGAGVALQQLLVELGTSATDAAKAIEKDTIAALNRLKGAFENDINSQINEASGYGYVNDFNALFADIGARMADAVALGADTSSIDKLFAFKAQEIVDSAQIMGSAFDNLIAGWPQLTGIIHEFTDGLKGAAKEADIAARRLGYLDRLFAATNDTSTLEGHLAAYNRTAQRERQEELRKGGQAILELDAAQAAERYNIIKAWNDKTIEDQKRAAEEARSFWDRFTRQIREYTDGLRAGAESPLSPGARLAAAQSQYNAQLLLAQGGDRDALNSITSYSGDLLDAAKAMYSSSGAYQTIFNSLITQLEALPDQVTETQLIIEAVTTGAQATVDAITMMQQVLKASVDSGSAQQTAIALQGYFNNLDSNTDSLLSSAEFLSGLGPLATQNEQAAARSIFNNIDADGNGMISKQEATNAALIGSGSVKSAIDATATQLLALAQISGNTANASTYASQTASNTGAISSSSSGSYSYLSTYLSNLSGISTNTGRSAANLSVANANRVIPSPGAYAPLPGYADGGLITGSGTGRSDSIPIMASNREFMMSAAATSAIGVPMLNYMNDNLRMPTMTSFNGQSNAALIREIRGLRAEVAALTAVSERGHAGTRKAVDEQTEAVKADTRKMARPDSARRGAKL